MGHQGNYCGGSYEIRKAGKISNWKGMTSFEKKEKDVTQETTDDTNTRCKDPLYPHYSAGPGVCYKTATCARKGGCPCGTWCRIPGSNKGSGCNPVKMCVEKSDTESHETDSHETESHETESHETE